MTATPSPAGTSEPAGSTPPEEAGWRRLDPRMLLLHPVQELPRALPALIGLLVAGSSRGNGQAWSFVGVAIVVGLGVMRWVTTSYRITPDQVQVSRGLLRRQVLTVPRDRVRTVDVTAHALHRLLGLARVTVGTGQSDRERSSGIRLDGLSLEQAAGLREELLHRRPHPNGAAAPTPGVTATAALAPPADELERELARLDPAWIRFGPFTLSGVVTLGLLAGFLSQLVNEAHVDPSRFGLVRSVVEQLAGASLWLAVFEVVAAAVLVVAAASTFGYVLAFWGFRLVRHSGGTLQVTRGLVTMRATTIEERRLRGVEVSEPLLLRAVGGARCIAIATGLRVGRGAERGGSMLLPPAPRAEVQRVAAMVLGRREPVLAALRAHGPAARRRRYTRALPVCGLLAAAAAALWWWLGLPAWVVVASLALLPLGALAAADRYRNLGHEVLDRMLVSASGSLLRRRNLLACGGIIGWNLRQSFFQRRVGLVTLTATTAAGRQAYRVQDVSVAEALRVAEEAVPGLLAPFLAAPAAEPPARKAPIPRER